MNTSIRNIAVLLLSATILACHACLIVQGSSDEDDMSDLPPEVFQPAGENPKDGWVYGKLEYEHDILAPDCYFMLLRAHPGSPVPAIEGGYHTTDVHVTLKLNGVEVPRALQEKSTRNRPHDWLRRERHRWDQNMQYVWSVCGPNRTFRVRNLKIVEDDKVLTGDIEFLLGGQWHLLAISMLNDGLVLPEGGNWDFGGREFGTLNPNIPK